MTFCDSQDEPPRHLQCTYHDVLNPNLQSFSRAIPWETRPHHRTGSSDTWGHIFLPLATSPLVQTHHARKTVTWTHKGDGAGDHEVPGMPDAFQHIFNRK